MTSPQEILSALSACGAAVNSADYTVYSRDSLNELDLAYCRAASGNPACLWLGSKEPLPRSFRTSGLYVHTLAKTRVSFQRVREVTNVIAFECLSPGLLWEFAVMLSALADETRRRQALDVKQLVQIMSRWLTLFSSPISVDRNVELGLWGELWVVDSSSDPAFLLEGWRGPEGGSSDFFLGGRSLEVKTTRRAGVHHVSQTQISRKEGLLLSLCVEEDPQGRTCKDLILSIADKGQTAAGILGALGSREAACINCEEPSHYSLAMQPVAFDFSSVPMVRAFDAGVTRLRYEITLDFDNALGHEQASPTLAQFRIDGILE